MKITFFYIAAVVAGIVGFHGVSFSGTPESGHQAHGQGNEVESVASSGHSDDMGEMIREGRVDGYGFMYHLITMPVQAKGAPAMAATHHLMVYISTPDGKPADSGTVGYLIKGPEGEIQQKMAMAMGGGFGADVTLAGKGSYAVKTKAVINGRTLIDDFIYKAE